MSMPSDPLKLEEVSTGFEPSADRRPKMPEPLPVRLVAVEDVHVPAPAGQEVELDAFYVGMLRFERDRTESEVFAYRAENFRIVFDVSEPPIRREDLRPVVIEVPVLVDIERQLIEQEIESERQRGLTPAQDQLVLLDPAGNWVALSEMREFR
jgi:hypothetical protein